MKIKTRMIGMDLDGTLLKSDKELTQYTKDVLKRAIEQGIIVMPATGRPIRGGPKELLEFPGIRYAVTANGGRVIDLEKNEAIVEELLPHDIAEEMKYFNRSDYIKNAIMKQFPDTSEGLCDTISDKYIDSIFNM